MLSADSGSTVAMAAAVAGVLTLSPGTSEASGEAKWDVGVALYSILGPGPILPFPLRAIDSAIAVSKTIAHAPINQRPATLRCGRVCGADGVSGGEST